MADRHPRILSGNFSQSGLAGRGNGRCGARLASRQRPWTAGSPRQYAIRGSNPCRHHRTCLRTARAAAGRGRRHSALAGAARRHCRTVDSAPGSRVVDHAGDSAAVRHRHPMAAPSALAPLGKIRPGCQAGAAGALRLAGTVDRLAADRRHLRGGISLRRPGAGTAAIGDGTAAVDPAATDGDGDSADHRRLGVA